MRRRLIDALTNDVLLKLTAIGLAFLLWTTVTTPDPVTIDGIPVDVIVRDSGWSLRGGATPATVTIEMTGPLRQLVRVATERPALVVTVDQVSDSVQTVELRSSSLSLTAGMEDVRVEAIRPLTVNLRFDRVTSRVVPLSIGLIGEPPAAYELAGPVTLDPPSVRATGPSRLLAELDTIRLEAVDLTQRIGTDTITLRIDQVPGGIAVDPLDVRVIVPLRPVPPDTTGTGGGISAAALAPAGRRAVS